MEDENKVEGEVAAPAEEVATPAEEVAAPAEEAAPGDGGESAPADEAAQA